MNNNQKITEVYEKQLIRSAIFYVCDILKMDVPEIKYCNCDFIEFDLEAFEIKIDLMKFECLPIEDGIFWLFFYVRNLYQNCVISGKINNPDVFEEWFNEKEDALLVYDKLNYDLKLVIDAIAFAKCVFIKFDLELNSSPSINIPNNRKIAVESLFCKFVNSLSSEG